MTRELQKIIYPAASLVEVNGICQAVDIVQNKPLLFNGYIADRVNNTAPILQNTGTTRTIKLQTIGDLSSVTFTIIGKQNGIIITESINGSRNMFSNPVESSEFYDEIISITPNNNSLLKLDIALGNKVYILSGLNLNTKYINYSLSISTKSGTNVISLMKIYNSLNNISELGITYKNLVNNTHFLHLLDEKNENFTNYVLPNKDIISNTWITHNFLIYLEIHSSHEHQILFNFVQL